MIIISTVTSLGERGRERDRERERGGGGGGEREKARDGVRERIFFGGLNTFQPTVGNEKASDVGLLLRRKLTYSVE